MIDRGRTSRWSGAQIKNRLRGQHRYRDPLLFDVGINTALRISDLLALRVEHFTDAEVCNACSVKKECTGSKRMIAISVSVLACGARSESVQES
jgi:hypothetical protein